MEAVNKIRPLIFLLLVFLGSTVLVQAQFRTDPVTWAASAGSSNEVPKRTTGYGVTMKPILECVLDAPPIVADNINLRYTPMPFPLTVTVTNTGDVMTDSVWARIMLPKDLELAAPDVPDHHTKLILPSLLFAAQSGSATWQVSHPLMDVEKSYVVTVWVKTANADSSKCQITVMIPPFDSPILAPRCYVPASLYFDDTLDTYVPNPITLRLTCVNMGNTNAFNVEGTIILPPDLELDPPTQAVTKTFAPSTMSKWIPPAPPPELIWTVRWRKRYRNDTTAQIRFTVTGKNFLGAQLDSTDVRCAIPVPGVQPLFACENFDMPDSLALNAAGLDVEPNPFSVSFRIRNKGNTVGRITRVFISFPPDGLSLDPSSPNPMNQTMSLDLDKDESRTFEWIIKVVENRITRRLPLINVTAIDDEGNYIACEKYLPIANLKTAMRCDLRTSERELRYIRALGEYAPDHFVISATLTNTGGANLHDVVAELEWTDPSGQDLVEFDPDYEDNTNPKTLGVLLPGLGQTFSWGLRLKNKNTTGDPQGLTFNIKYGSRETPFIVNGPEVPVHVDTIPAARFDTQCSGPDTIYVDTQAGVYINNPFDVTFTVCNVGRNYADSLKAMIMIQSQNIRTMPGYPIVLEKAILTGTDTLGVHNCYTFRWSLEALPGANTTRARIKFMALALNAEPSECEISIVIPPLNSPVLSPRCFVPSQLVFDENADQYIPNPFTVSVTCVNIGNSDAFNVEGTIILPPGLEFDPPMQPVTRLFTPSTMSTYIPLAPEPTLTWTVRWRTRPRYDVTREICFKVTGKNVLGAQLDTTEVCCAMFVQGVPPLLVCDALEMPDSLALNASGTDVEPNPFTVSFTIRNNGIGVGRMTRLYISFPTTDGLSLDPGSPSPMDHTGSLEFGKDDWRSFQWIIKVQNRLTRRVSLISVTAIDDEGNPITCEYYLPIAGVGTVGIGSAPLPTATRLEQNRPNPFNPMTTIEYNLGEASEYSLSLFDALGRMVRVLESGQKPAGSYSYVLDATGLASGVYLYKLETPGFSETKRMILSR